MKNYVDPGECYDTLLEMHNCSYRTQPHPIIIAK